MGVDIQGLRFLKAIHNDSGDFKKTLTIGRQGMYIQKHSVEAILGIQDFGMTDFCEPMLQKYFGSTIVDSIDNSTYEGASLIYDLNNPLPNDIGKYDTIFDGGCLEHIFNINQALKNLSGLCNPGGQIIHVLPANNQCGHGFWQFSPELFFSLYSEKNGYKDTIVFVGDTADANWTYRVMPPEKGQRHDIQHHNPIYVMVRTILNGDTFSHDDVQQSDYDYIWKQSEK